jgi:hypothetical protein
MPEIRSFQSLLLIFKAAAMSGATEDMIALSYLLQIGADFMV